MARPVGATTRPQFYTYVTEIERKEYAKWVKSVYKKPAYKEIAKWYGDQLFGKAVQPVGGDDGKGNVVPILVKIIGRDADNGDTNGV